MTVERRVIMLSRERLATFAFRALGNGRSVACLESPVELADWSRPPVDVVLLDLPRHHRGIIYRQLRQRYRGPVLALLDHDDDGGGLPPDRGPLAILNRPFSGEELSEALGALLAPPDQVHLPSLPAAAPPGPPESPGPPRPPQPPGPARPAGPGRAPGPAGPPTASRVAAAARPRPAGRSRWRWLARRRVRRWQIVAATSAVLILGLSFGAQSGCGTGCGGVAGAADGSSVGTLANSELGSRVRSPTSGSTFTGSTVAPSGAVAAIGGPVSGISLEAGASSSSSPSLLDTATSGGSIIGALVGPTPPTWSPLSAATTTSQPATTAQPTTSTPTTAAPTTAPPTTAAPTTEAPTTAPPTTAAPTTEAPTTAPPTTEPPETTAAGSEQA